MVVALCSCPCLPGVFSQRSWASKTFFAISLAGIMKYSKLELLSGLGIPPGTQKKFSPYSFSAFNPTLQVELPGTMVLPEYEQI